MSDFEFQRTWLPRKGTSEADVTMCRLKIKIGDRFVTDFVDENDRDVTHLEIPAYFLAEWVAENWWALLWEPRKSEDEGDDTSFLSRHSFLNAQHGFALPKVLIVPIGKTIHISAAPRDVQFADIRFRRGSVATCKRDEVEGELHQFVQGVVDRLIECNLGDTCLQEAWSSIVETDEEERQFCQFVGALGGSPYDLSEEIASSLERLLGTIGERLLMDLCLVAKEEEFASVAMIAERAAVSTRSAAISTLEPVSSIAIPADSFSAPAWRRGVRTAERIRAKFGIKDTDPRGATRIFEALRIDTGRRDGALNSDEELTIVGAVERNDLDARVALLQSTELKRRFAAARAIFSALTTDKKQESRLLTLAVTRDQQASRAFAAELTAPLALIRSHAKKASLSQSKVFDLAADLEISADVVSKQALNNGIRVTPF
jgi:hypothetical protein